ncbi:hypothetical protein ES703_65779 [subsurface metagenome]
MKFICVDCAISDVIATSGIIIGSPGKMGLLRAIYHRIRGHHVIKAWKTATGCWEIAFSKEKEET